MKYYSVIIEQQYKIRNMHMAIVFLSHQPHLPVDGVLEAECVGRSAEDWQLQNEPLDRRRTFYCLT